MFAEHRSLYVGVAKAFLMLLIAIAFCRIMGAVFIALLGVFGVCWSLCRKNVRALAVYSLLPLMIIMSPAIVPKTELIGAELRIAPLIIGLAMCVGVGRRKGAYRLPFGALFLYLFCSCISSATGWSPMISYLKTLNFIVFLLGIWIGTQNLQENPQEVYGLRCVFLGLICVIVFGSLATLPFPTISYSTSLAYHNTLSEAEKLAYLANLENDGGVTLFSGIANHSQALSPMLAVCFTLVLADMVFIVEKMSILHATIIVASALELFMTRSRTGLLSLVVGVATVLFYASRKVRMSWRSRMAVKKLVSVGVALLIIVVGISEIKSHAVSRWILKTNDLASVCKGAVIDQVAGSRQGLIEKSLQEFKMNPLFGMGFQVNWETQELFSKRGGLILSAPVEKGLLVTTILGEGGLVGSLAFLAFLISFYTICGRKKLVLSIVMFTTMLATNFGEATFFSSGGVGGIIWVLCVVGGFTLDMNLMQKQRGLGLC